ncbi:MAG TPA: NADH-quinone oxidoreductase subunit NuoG [Fimbriimonas sp.]
MAAVASPPTVNITINDIDIAVPKGELIVESVKRLGLEIPIFCYHPRMKPVGMCRMCLVEVGTKQPDGSVRKMPKPQAACTLPASEGLVVYTDTEMVHNDRRGVLEFLLINHPLDCPVCDRGGECPLQNNTLFYGPSTSRYLEIKRHAPKAFPLSRYVTLDLERCIQCGRCVRFTEEISGDAQLAFRFRGASMQPSTFELRDFTSKFSGNVIEICPVGALTSATYRFRARPWDLESRPAICTVCSNGCSVWFDYRGNKVARINGRTNEAVNEEWTCDRGKFGHNGLYNEKRLSKPLVRKDEKLVPSEWSPAYGEILDVFQSGSPVAAIAGQRLSNEDLFTLRELFSETLVNGQIAHRNTLISPTKPLQPTLRIADLETKPTILVFGTSLADEEPILFLRVRKAWFNHGAKVIVAHHESTEVDGFAHSVIRYRKGEERQVARALASGSAEGTGLSESTLAEVRELLQGGAAILATTGLFNLTDGNEIVESLQALGGEFHMLAREPNELGAELILDGDRDMEDVLRGCAEGSIRALWLAGVDPYEAFRDRDLVTRALETVDFLVVQGTNENEATGYASVVLPQTAPAEQDGSYTNVEGRVQRIRPILKPFGESKPAWRIFSEVAVRAKAQTPFFNPGEVMERLSQVVPSFNGLRYGELGGEGFVLGVGPDEEREVPMPVQTNG